MSKHEDAGRSRPQRFDAFGLVARRGHLEGTVDPLDFDRIQDVLGEDEGGVPEASIAWRIAGETDGLGRESLAVTLDGEVPLECQRCMRVFVAPVHHATSLLLAHDEKELAYLDENDEREVILAAGPLDPLEVIEDELVLTLPYVPRCERADCDADDAAQPGTDRPSPFGALAGLRKERKPGDA